MTKVLIDSQILESLMFRAENHEPFSKISWEYQSIKNILENSRRADQIRKTSTNKNSHKCRDIEYFNWYNESING